MKLNSNNFSILIVVLVLFAIYYFTVMKPKNKEYHPDWETPNPPARKVSQISHPLFNDYSNDTKEILYCPIASK